MNSARSIARTGGPDELPKLAVSMGGLQFRVTAQMPQLGDPLMQREDFDLVLSDIKMPDKTGYDVFASARRRSLTVPVILMTGFGYDPNHSIVRASQEGLQAVLFKPFKVDQLLSEVRKALQAQSVR